MFTKQCVVTLDLEGVLAPEIWIAVAEKTGIKDLRLTTRDIPDYDVLMKGRIAILDRENIKLSDIQNVIANLGLLEGARDFMDKLRDETQVIILSDTFQEFAYPIMKNLAFPTIFCHNLIVENDRIKGYRLRMSDQKTQVVKHLQALNFKVSPQATPSTIRECSSKPKRCILLRTGFHRGPVPAARSHQDLRRTPGKVPPVPGHAVKEPFDFQQKREPYKLSFFIRRKAGQP
jgi:phosphoserine phosphatase/homoserine phosphotransferase bifunctional protein